MWRAENLTFHYQVGIKVLNHVINSAILIFVMSAANSDLYIGSRTLYGLAIEGKAPAIFKKVTGRGVPLPALVLCTAFCSLVFLNVAASGAKGQIMTFSNHWVISYFLQSSDGSLISYPLSEP